MSDRITVEAFDLDQVDTDGALREAGAATAGDTRAQLFKKAAVGGASLIGGGVLLSGLAAPAMAKPSKKQDVAILNYALTLEYLEAAFYTEAVSKGAISGDALEAAKIVRDHENAHVKAIKSVLGGRPSRSRSSTSRTRRATRRPSWRPRSRWRTPACPPTRARDRA